MILTTTLTTSAFDLAWKHVMIISERTLSDTEKVKVLKEACNFVDSLHLSSSKYSVGDTTIPHKDPYWDYNNPNGQWEKEHLIICIKAGLKTRRRKPINSSKFSAISQEPNENPTAFLERLKEAIIKYSNLDLDSLEGKTILKDRFLTQSAPDIRRKLRKLTQELSVNLDEFLATATTTFYNWDQEKEVKAWETEKRKKIGRPNYWQPCRGKPHPEKPGPVPTEAKTGAESAKSLATGRGNAPTRTRLLRYPVQNAKEVAIGEPTALGLKGRGARGSPLVGPRLTGAFHSRWTPCLMSVLLDWSQGQTWMWQAQRPWLTGPATPRHVGSSRTEARTHVRCIGRPILNHCATREARDDHL
ncbi:uncharacterized protein LOC125964236 [Orcinus orca]|uniref:uncharacterized protein LOC125964236 n=1 Tax=Orcinus orca TaxID=9733 RepID=UPI002112ED7D|nr:uncharacterized protein LOC125964236 [Orcinus orca]